MSKRKAIQRLTAMVLSVIMVVGMTPVSALAETGEFPIGASGEVTAFEALESDIAVQNVPIGTSQADLELPNTLMATIRLAASEEELVLDSGETADATNSTDTVSGSAIGVEEMEESEISDSEGDEIASSSDAEKIGDSSEAKPTEETVDSAKEITVPLPVTWTSSPEYDGEAAGTYIFTPEARGYTVSAELPQITVTVEAEKAPSVTEGEITSFESLDNEIAQQSLPVGTPISELVLPKNLAATVGDTVASVPVKWISEPEYNPGSEDEEPGEYIFTPQLGEGFSLAEGVSAPQITVITTIAVKRGLMSADSSVDITDKTVAEIKEAIETALITNSAVTVTGSKTGVAQTLTLSIDSSKTVKWGASFFGDSGFSDTLISLTDKGIFEVTTDGTVSATGNNSTAISATGLVAKVTVSGGTVSATGCNSTAISATGLFVEVTVSGGTVSATDSSGIAIYANSAAPRVTVSGGKVEASAASGIAIHTAGSVEIKDTAEVSAPGDKGIAIYTTGEDAKVTIHGGTVRTTTGAAIYTTGGNAGVGVHGGTVRATTGAAIYTTGEDAIVRVRGGVVFAHRPLVQSPPGQYQPSVIDMANNTPLISDSALVIAWDQATAGENPAYETGSSDHLATSSSDRAWWQVVGGKGGILFQRGDDTDFLAVDGVTILSVGNTVNITNKSINAIERLLEAALGAHDTVNVTGSKTAANDSLEINIPDGKSLVWAAEYKGTILNLISLTGNGTFEVTTGGTVSATGSYGTALSATGGGATVTLSGDATISGRTAINTAGSVEIKDTATVSATDSGTAIFATGGGATVTVSGDATISGRTAINTAGSVEIKDTAEVSAPGDKGIAIYTTGEDANVTIHGGTVRTTTGAAIYATGGNAGVMVRGGTVRATTGAAIYTTGEDANVTVSGGTVSASDSIGIAIYAAGAVSNVTVSGGMVSATGGGTAIFATGGGATVTVSGDATISGRTAILTAGSVLVKDNGTVSGGTGSDDIAIYATGGGSTVTVSGDATISGTTAINTAGSVEIKDTATVSATDRGTAIFATGGGATVTVSGDATISGRTAILTAGSVLVKDNGTVSGGTGSDDIAIYATGGGSTVTVSGDATISGRTAISTAGSVLVKDSGTVSATGSYGIAIFATGGGSTVTVSGGTVTGAGAGYDNPVIYMYGTPINAATVNVTVSGSGKVEATANNGVAINTGGSAEIKDSGTVSASGSSGCAILATGASSTVTVSGGTVFASRKDIIGSTGVLYFPNSSVGFTAPTGTGTVIAWDSAANNRIYSLRSTDNIATSPAGVTAYWYNSSEGNGGIAYKNGVNEGFVPLTGVTVTKITLEEVNLTYTDPSTLNHAYNGSAQGIGAVTHSGSGTATVETGGIITVHYVGTGDTVYAKSTTAPTNAGTYAVTAEISGGTEYVALAGATAIELGSYTIAPMPVTITPDSGQSKKYGAADPVLTYAATPTLLGGDSFTGALSRAWVGTEVGEQAGTSCSILLGTLNAGDNYALSLSPIDVSFYIEQAKVQSIDTTVDNVTMSAYDARNAATANAVISLANLPASVSVTTDGGTDTLPIIWYTDTPYNAKGAVYTVTGSLTGDINIDANGVDKDDITVTVTPVMAVNPTFSDTFAIINDDASATASELGTTILTTSSTVTVEGESISYAINWNGSQTLDRTAVDNSTTFTGVISYPGAPNWLTIPADLSVSRKVTVTAKTLVTIGGVTTPDRTYSGAAYAPGGTVTASDGFPVWKLVWLYESTDGGAYSSSTAPTNAGAYKLTISVPESNPNYIGSETFTFTIDKREITLTADNKTVIKGGSLPTLTYRVGNLAPNDTASDALSTEPTLACPTFDGNALGDYPITLSGGTAADNYTITRHTGGTITVVEQTYTVTFNLGGGTRTGGGALTQIVTEGDAAEAPTVTRSGYTFIRWDKAFDNVSSALTVTAIWSYNGGGGGGSYTPDIPATIIPEKKPDQPVMATAPVTATRGTNGTASATIPEKAITDAIAKAQADARAQGKTANGISVALNVTMPKGTTSLAATLTRNSLNGLVSAGVTEFEISGAPVSLSLDLNALKEIQKQSSGDISITIAPATGLSKEAKALLGNRPVYSITISYVDKNGKTQTITSLGSGLATLSIPYTPGKNEAVGYLFGVYVDANGKAQRIDGSAYDVNSGSLLIPTSHFSVYGVGYTAPSAKFTDIGTHWGKEAIDYVVDRGLLSGTSKTTFAPDTAMTRGMLVTALGRLAGVDVKSYTTNSFTDVKADSAFRPYIEWAYKNGVVQGIGNKQFAPDQAITREEIAVIFANYAKATGYKLPVTREATTYADASSIGSIYKTAVTAMQQAGIMMGGTGNKFNPKASATRAEVSAMLHRYIKLTIDPATAQNWAKNDAGQWFYYKDGKALTGTQTIDGVKYFFETTGVLKTGWVKDGSNWRYYTGNKVAVDWLDISDKRYYFTKDGLMVSGKWLEIGGKWYYFNADGSLAKNTKVDGYEVDKNGVRKTK